MLQLSAIILLTCTNFLTSFQLILVMTAQLDVVYNCLSASGATFVRSTGGICLKRRPGRGDGMHKMSNAFIQNMAFSKGIAKDPCNRDCSTKMKETLRALRGLSQE